MTYSSTTLPPALPRRRRWLTALLALIIFVGGNVVGGVVTVGVIVHRLRDAAEHPEQIPARLTDRLTHRLNLDQEQSAQVEQIIAQRLSNVQALRRQMWPQLQSQLQGLRVDVGQVLDNTQQEKWDVMCEDFNRNWLPLIAPGANEPVVPATQPTAAP